MAKLWFKFQRYFRRKPVRFFTFLALYLTAGSLVFLHSGFVGQPAVSGNQANPAAAGGPAEGAELPFLGDMHLGRGFRDTGEASSIARRYGPWFKGKDGNERAKLGDYGGAWSRALKGRVVREKEEERDGSAVFRGCFRRPDNLSLALPVTAAMLNMSVDKCVDFCTEKEYPLAALAGTACHCGFPTTRFPLHDREDEQLCAQKCSAEEFESCGTPSYFIVYQTQVQDNRCMDRRFLPGKSKQLIALASFPGAGNTWARHLIELATGFYTGSYYFDGSLYNKGFKGERDHWRSGRTICIKTHESGQKEIEAFDAAILLIRNPYKALMAEFNRKYGGHIGFAAHAHWKGKEWPEFVRNYAPWWATHTLDWLKFGKKVLVVHFEDLKQDLFIQLGRMVNLLGVAVREDRLLCVESQKDGNFKRSGLRKLEYDPYTADMQKTISAYIKMVDAALKGRNLTGVPDDYYPR
ncbi:sialate:O-sulfotransferase 2 isoform X2 [Macaca nemestrina]|uniref:WSC domain-containing protein 2 isoform X2 n=1 Tax=Cercocebus atys TaxID=9531 RepID=UPI0005F36B87|nr:PREDICTED: WSC domain-containing protein 2 isoform X2 [Cercocebus atys]XP_015286980.1 WSC domain-containing protein 2 isoform X2 [Macaca fascicularis]XP_028685665.1 WSC domain-containing protein 2 isoform X2 [Macaca mulatta]XP_050605717.1 WSC domain-containing protein 2 isoform X2 [Macaca thibetana thibetana]